MFQYVPAAGPVPSSGMSFVAVPASFVSSGHFPFAATGGVLVPSAGAKAAAVEGAVVGFHRSNSQRKRTALQE